MDIKFSCGKEVINLKFPDESIIYTSCYESENTNTGKMMLDSISNPIGCLSLKLLLQKRKKGKIVIVVSDITRPIPYHSFLPELLAYIHNEGIGKDEIMLLIATGMHRASTLQERIYMFGQYVVDNYEIIDHCAENINNLTTLPEKSWSGNAIKLNKNYVEAGFRILTGLVETHFMSRFSAGRKSICLGLASLDTVQRFHGYNFLSHPNASNAILDNNPCHLENSSIAKACPADFLINIILDQKKKINSFFSGEQFESHEAAVSYVKEKSCQRVGELADAVVTSCGGYPLDGTFYQCVKGLVNCLPALKENGEIIAFGGCNEGIGSSEYEQIMKKYSLRHNDFLNDIESGDFFIKDQWQFQMHIRVLKKTGQNNLHFYTAGIPQDELKLLSVNAHSISGNVIEKHIQMHIDNLVSTGKKIAVFPEGPYCSPVNI